MSELLRFYDNRPNVSGYVFTYVMSWDNEDLEDIHDWVQWVFPTDEPSRFNPDAPVLTQADILAFHDPEQEYGRRLEASERRFRIFLGMDRVSRITTPHDHNLLRVTRAVRSLRLLRSPERARAFRDDVLALIGDRGVTEMSEPFWEAALL